MNFLEAVFLIDTLYEVNKMNYKPSEYSIVMMVTVGKWLLTEECQALLKL